MIHQREYEIRKGIFILHFTEKGSPGFDKFLEILGERIRLKNWDKYRGGLDIKGIFSFSHVDTLHRNITLELLFSISIISKALI